MMIGVIGGETCSPAEGEAAFAVGRELAARGHTLVCGGRGGVMREACRGARAEDGVTVGILPGDNRADMNEFVTVPIVTGIGFARNTMIPRTADALVAVGGRYGTLSEIAFALIAGKPVVTMGSWDLTLPDGATAPLVSCDDAGAAIDACERLAAGAS
ncbi:MAG: TIGR00725 family protein [Dehalococcoidia bacterium]|nr:TIGR00725 family protein [Dehalococcoidia bacterium]